MNNVAGKIKKLVSRKSVWGMCDQGPPGREGTPLMVIGVFAVALSWIYIRIRCPIIQVPLPEVHNKTTKINGFALQQPFLEQGGLCQTMVRPSIADRCGMTNNHRIVSSVACQRVRSFSQWSYCFGLKHCIAALPPGTS